MLFSGVRARTRLQHCAALRACLELPGGTRRAVNPLRMFGMGVGMWVSGWVGMARGMGRGGATRPSGLPSILVGTVTAH